MSDTSNKYRFLLIHAFSLPPDSQFLHRPVVGAKESRLPNYPHVKPYLDGIDWELDQGPLAPFGDWAVENREEFALVAAGRLPIVKKACESGKYNAIVLLGGGEPGFQESREIARPFGIPVTSCGYSQMHIATMLGNKFSIIDLAESHNMYYYNLVIQHRFERRCASIRNVQIPFMRPGHQDEFSPQGERQKAERGERSEMVERAVNEAVCAIEEDGAEVITFGCSATFWLRPYVEKRLHDMGWEIPVLEGYSCAISLAKMLVDLGVTASGLMFPGDRPKKWRRKKTF
jgi:Asp/Glu/hydantoin racemase